MTSTSTSTEALLRQYFEAVVSGDRSIFERILADDITYRFPGRSPFANTYRGKAELFAYLDRLGAETEGTLGVTVDHVFADDELGAALVRPKATRKGHELEWSMVIVFTIRDGKIAGIRLHYADQYAIDEFLSR